MRVVGHMNARVNMQSESIDILTQLESWYAQENGQYILDASHKAVSRLLETAFGYHVLQLGIGSGKRLCESSPINHHIYCNANATGNALLQATPEELPLESDSIDLVVAHHCLEFSERPHQVLREIQRVLTPQGRVLLIGFNPYSLFGFGVAVRALGKNPLWQRHQRLGEHRITDWLHLLGCEVQSVKRLYSVPPVGRGRLRQAIVHCDEWAARLNLPVGGVYMLYATKQVAGRNGRRPVVMAKTGRLIGLVPKPAQAPSSSVASTSLPTSSKIEKIEINN